MVDDGFLRAEVEGFLSRPLTEGRFVGGRGARVLGAGLGVADSWVALSGLVGVRAREMLTALGGGMP